MTTNSEALTGFFKCHLNAGGVEACSNTMRRHDEPASSHQPQHRAVGMLAGLLPAHCTSYVPLI